MAQGTQSDRPIRVAIVGGGCAGISAAWQLSRQSGYEIHVFEKSWRLGGKGASVRANDGRILEHGLHLWLGCYDNAFRMMRECYEEVEALGCGPDAKKKADRLAHANIDEAFLAEPHIGVGLPGPEGAKVWSGFFPPEKGRPGDPLEADSNPFTLANYLLRCLRLLKTLMHSVISAPGDDIPGMPRPEDKSKLDEALNLSFSLDAAEAAPLLIERMAQLVRVGGLTGFAALLQAVTILENWLQEKKLLTTTSDTALGLMEAVAAQMRKLLRDAVAVDPDIRTRTEVIDIVLTIAVGLFRDRVLFDDRGLDAINDTDYRQWLYQHGATKSAVESQFLAGIYDFVFAYRDGDKANPELAAGVALRGALRMFLTYRGSMFWRVRSGMGDTIFAPLYKILSTPDRKIEGEDGKTTDASPVHFHFLHELQKVNIEADSHDLKYVTSLHFKTYGTVTGTALDDAGCWPDNPGDNASLGESAAEWKFGDDFDGVVLATGIEDFKKICKGALADSTHGLPPYWQRMCEEVKTVATQSAQLWLTKDTQQLGWYRQASVVTALGVSFDTWADMTHTLASEKAWRQGVGLDDALDHTRSVAYFCGPLSDTVISQASNDAAALDNKVSADLEQLLHEGMVPYWPDIYSDTTNMDGLVLAQHVEANFEGSDRYTLSLPGSLHYRISPLDRSVENMTIAGDWTACGFDAGCVESAVMSGMLASFAICGQPEPETIIGYDHP